MSDLLYRNRRLLVLTLVLILATGGFAYMQLPRQEDPTLVPRFGLILTYLPGASATRVEALVSAIRDEFERSILYGEKACLPILDVNSVSQIEYLGSIRFKINDFENRFQGIVHVNSIQRLK